MRSLVIRIEADDSLHDTKIVQQFERFLGIPRFRIGQQDETSEVSLNQACLLEAPEIPLKCVFPNLNCCRYNDRDGLENDTDELLRFPLLMNLSALRRAVKKNGGIDVYKVGGVTGTTVGTLFTVGQPSPHSDLVVKLKIHWKAPDKPFAISGDSGSLVFARDGDVIVPLGLHCGTEDTVSYSLSLQSLCQTISDLLDADLVFCAPDECGLDAVVPPFEPIPSVSPCRL